MNQGYRRIIISFAAALLLSAAVLAVVPETDTADTETAESAQAAESVQTAQAAAGQTAVPESGSTDSQKPAETGSESPDAAEAAQTEEEPAQTEEEPAQTSLLLITDSHTAYAAGTEPGYFAPDASLTRAEAAQMLYSLLSVTEQGTYESSWSDVDADTEGYAAITLLSSLGILTGYEDGTFRPDDAITRCELVAIMARFFPMEEGENPFPDVYEAHWAFSYIVSAATKGWLSGYDDGTFHPDEPITRAEAVALINAALGRSAESEDTAALLAADPPCIYVDVSPSDPFYYDVLEATTDHTADTESGGEVWTDFTYGESGFAEGICRLGDAFYMVGSSGQFVTQTPGILEEDGTLYYVAADGSMPVLETGPQELYGALYYVLEDGTLAADTQIGELYFGADGAYTTGDEELDEMVEAALAECITDDMTQDEKLYAAYLYVRDNFTYLSMTHVKRGGSDWEAEYAKWIFEKGKGNCYAFSAAFMYMARRLGYDATAVSGAIYLFGSVLDHGWTMIDNLIYDVETEYAYLYRYSVRASYNLFGRSRSSVPFTYYFPD